MKFYTLLFSILLLTGCSNSALKQELADTKEKLKQAEAELAQKAPIVHVVYFPLKKDANQAKIISEINKLRNIEVVHNLEIGIFKDLKDNRALSKYQIMMSMEFKNEADYHTYEDHEIHLALKKAVGTYLADSLATYDYK